MKLKWRNVALLLFFGLAVAFGIAMCGQLAGEVKASPLGNKTVAGNGGVKMYGTGTAGAARAYRFTMFPTAAGRLSWWRYEGGVWIRVCPLTTVVPPVTAADSALYVPSSALTGLASAPVYVPGGADLIYVSGGWTGTIWWE